MKFVIIPVLIWFISQTLKFFIRLFSSERKNIKDAIWVYSWAGGAPSTHTATIFGTLFLVGKYEGFNALFGFCFVTAMIIIYNLVEDRKKEEMREGIFYGAFNKILGSSKLLDISGHKFIEIVIGLPLGLISAYLLDKIIR